MAKTAILAVKIVSDSKAARKDFDDTASSMDKFEKGLGKAAAPAALAGGAVIAFAAKTGEMASIAEQNVGAVKNVFKEYADSVFANSSKAADSVGLSKSAYEEMAVKVGSQLKNMGTPMGEVGKATDDMIKKGADLASMYGGTTADAVSALSGLLRGERDPIERYAVSMNQSAIDAKKAEMGLKGLTGEADKNANLQATMALLNGQTADSMGNFAKEADTAAGAHERANAKMADASAQIGTAFLPVMTEVSNAMAGAATWASQNKDLVVGVGGALLGLVGTILILSGVLKAITVVQGILNIVTGAWPVLLIVVAIVALVAAVIMAYNEIGWFKDACNAAFQFIQEAVANVGAFFVEAWRVACEIAKGVFTNVSSFIGTVLGNIGSFFSSAFAFVASVVQTYISIVTGIIGGIIGFVNDVVSNVRGGFAAAWEFVAGVAKGAISGITGGIQGIISWVNDAISKVRALFDAAGEVAGAVGKALGFGGTAITAEAYNYGMVSHSISGLTGPLGATGMAMGGSGFTPSAAGTTNIVKVEVTVPASAGTDRVALGNEILELLQTSLRANGMKGVTIG